MAVALVPDDHLDEVGSRVAGRTDGVPDKSEAADLVQDLGHLRLHAGALTSSEDDDSGWTSRVHAGISLLSGRGWVPC